MPKFRVDKNKCAACRKCERIAPDNISYSARLDIYYVRNQPKNEVELEACRKAVRHCPTDAIKEVGG